MMILSISSLMMTANFFLHYMVIIIFIESSSLIQKGNPYSTYSILLLSVWRFERLNRQLDRIKREKELLDLPNPYSFEYLIACLENFFEAVEWIRLWRTLIGKLLLRK